jgi:hypothetical protein
VSDQDARRPEITFCAFLKYLRSGGGWSLRVGITADACPLRGQDAASFTTLAACLRGEPCCSAANDEMGQYRTHSLQLRVLNADMRKMSARFEPADIEWADRWFACQGYTQPAQPGLIRRIASLVHTRA